LSAVWTHEDAARFSFLLATPIILAPGLQAADLLGPTGDGSAARYWWEASRRNRGLPVVRFLSRYFTLRTLLPFAVYSLLPARSLLSGLPVAR